MSQLYLPEPDDEFLKEVVFSVRKRRKAIKHQSLELKCERLIAVDEDKKWEKIELGVRADRGPDLIDVSVHLWESRRVWAYARELSKKKGTIWEWSREGRLLGTFSGREIVEALEQSYERTYQMTANGTAEFDAIWSKMLAQGPKLAAERRE